ncbi:MAG: type II secretion system F family protein [Deltaproteobacteria bacterium]|nr:type II secretion system F family protein [Deltaproteobacteria bacterium]
MPQFTYEGKTRTGEVKKGTIEAPSRAAVTAQLRKQNITPTTIKESKKGGGGALEMNMSLNLALFQPSVNQKDVVVFARQFATMIDAGLPLVQCLEILASQQDNPTFKKVLFEVKADVEGGSTFAEALSKHPRIFDELFVSLIEAGEIGGILDTILNRLAIFLEKSIKLKRQIKGALIYPSAIISVAGIVTVVILIFVIPTFQKMFEGFDAALPLPTQIVIAVSTFVQNYIFLLIIGLIAAGFGIRQLYRTDNGRKVIDAMALKAPLVGPIIRKSAVARFTRTLGTMVSSGVPILEALTITAKTSGNRTIETAILQTRSSISEGKTIAEPLAESKAFPPMVVQMIAVGEATGSMDTMLQKIADFYEDEVDTAVKGLTSLLEPALMLFLGITVGGLIVSMYLPIFKLATVI